MGIGAWKMSLQEVAVDLGIEQARLKDLCMSGYAPCLIGESGECWFKKSDITTWVSENLYKVMPGKSLPFTIKVYHAPHYFADGKVPLELVGVEGLQEYLHPHIPPVVYFLVKDNSVVYVGQSEKFMGSRIGVHGHGNREGPPKDFDRVFFLPIPKNQLLDVERHFIKAIKPKLNGGMTND